MPEAFLDFFLPLTPFNQGRLPPPEHTADKHYFDPDWNVAYLGFYVILVFGAWMAHQTWMNALLFPLCLSTSVLAWNFYRFALNRRHSLDPARVRPADIFRGFSQGLFSGGLLTAVVQSLAAIELLYCSFGNGTGTEQVDSWLRDSFAQYTGRPVVHASALLFAIVSGLMQEWVKQLVITHCYKVYLDFPTYLVPADIEAYKWIGTAVGWGMGVMNAVMLVCVSLVSHPQRALVAALVKLTVHVPFEGVLGYMWGVSLAREDILLRRGLDNITGQKPRSMCTVLYRLGWRQYLLHAILNCLRFEFFVWVGRSGLKQEVISGLIGAVMLTISICIADLMHPRVHRKQQRVDNDDDELTVNYDDSLDSDTELGQVGDLKRSDDGHIGYDLSGSPVLL